MTLPEAEATSENELDRRRVIGIAACAPLVGGNTLAGETTRAPRAPATGRARSQLTPVRALVFDTFGTVVDWRTSISAQVETFARKRGLNLDPFQFADAWRAGYGPAMDRVRTGELPWTRLDDLHRMILDELLLKFGVKRLAEDDVQELSRAWHRLRPWPDAVGGLSRLKHKFIVAPLSNGNISLMITPSGPAQDALRGIPLPDR